jgi:hypothetical protein
MYYSLEVLLKRKNQRFVCTNGGWPAPAPPYVARIRHDVTPPLDEETLSQLRRQLGDVPSLFEFYRRWGSARLYCDTVHMTPIGYASAFFIAPPESWKELREGFEGWVEALTSEEREDLLPGWLSGPYVVVGEVPNSGNYFLIPVEGQEKGKVFEFEHDGFEFVEAGSDFAAFVDKLCAVDEGLLQDIRCHTRYSDGKTPAQWMCEQYFYDAGDS